MIENARIGRWWIMMDVLANPVSELLQKRAWDLRGWITHKTCTPSNRREINFLFSRIIATKHSTKTETYTVYIPTIKKKSISSTSVHSDISHSASWQTPRRHRRWFHHSRKSYRLPWKHATFMISFRGFTIDSWFRFVLPVECCDFNQIRGDDVVRFLC